MKQPHLSRHFLGGAACQPSCLEAIPFAPPGEPDEATGVATEYSLLAIGGWNEDAQEHQLTLTALAIPQTDTAIPAPPSLLQLASFRAPAAPTALAAAPGAIFLATADGSVARLRLGVPTVPGARPQSIDLRQDDIDESHGGLAPWAPQAHAGPATAVDVSAATGAVITAGLDGQLLTAPSGDAPGLSPLHAGAVPFTAARWATPATAATGSAHGTVHIWDARQPAAPTSTLGAGPALTALRVHPAQPHLVAAGDARGTVTIWDLRNNSSMSVSCSAEPSAVTALAFHEDTGALVAATAAGAVGLIDGSSFVPLHSEPSSAITALALTPSYLYAATDAEALVFMAHYM